MDRPPITLSLFLFFILFFSIQNIQSQCDNRSLFFDGVDDYVEINPGPLTTLPFTVEFFARSYSTSSQASCNSSQGETLFWMGTSPTDFVKIAECNGELFVEAGDGSRVRGFSTSGAPRIRNGLRHIAMTIQNAGSNYKMDLYVDCVNVLTTNNLETFSLSAPRIVLGQNGNQSGPLESFEGEIDDFRIWNVRRNTNDLCTFKDCIPPSGSPDLLAYYKMDQGMPGGNNTGISTLINDVSSGPPAVLNNFGLQGSTSNFDCSNSNLIHPDLNKAILKITDYPARAQQVTQICSGDPVHFCLSLNGLPIAPNPDISVTWEVNDGSGWTSLDPAIFNGFCFGVPPGELTIDCSASTTGQTTLLFRVVSSLPNTNSGGQACEYITAEFPLDVCCPVEPTTVDVATGYPNDLLCDGDQVSFNVSLNSYPFITSPATGVTIDWTFNGQALPYANQSGFIYTTTADATQGACFEATVRFCGKTGTFETCVPVDPIPKCGTIDTLMKPTPLTRIGNDVYEICPGQDAALKINDPFTDCIPVWQYSFTSGPGAVWTDMGTSNAQQNTNILPTSLWPGNNIFYRIECRPLSDPSGCEPCYSNIIEIQLKQGPSPGTISGNNFICFGDFTTLTHSGLDPTLTHQWICNGQPVGTGGPTFNATEGGCYWVESSDDCHAISTGKFCLDVCIIEPIISCPNVCPRPGVPITLSGCASKDNCNQNLSYSWSVTGANPPTINGCMITHIPDATGSTYTLTVTNALGCSATTSTTIIPCEE